MKLLIYKSAFVSSLDVFANMSIMHCLSTKCKICRSTAIKSKASNRPCNIVDRIRVFTLLSAENERSAVAELMGIATAIAYTLQSVGYASTKW